MKILTIKVRALFQQELGNVDPFVLSRKLLSNFREQNTQKLVPLAAQDNKERKERKTRQSYLNGATKRC